MALEAIRGYMEADMHAVDEAEWAALLARVVRGLAPADDTTEKDRTP